MVRAIWQNKKGSVEAEVPGFGDMCLHKEGLANVFGWDDLMQKGCRGAFNSDVENAFSVGGPDEELKGKFARTKDGLHAMKFGGGTPTNVENDECNSKDVTR